MELAGPPRHPELSVEADIVPAYRGTELLFQGRSVAEIADAAPSPFFLFGEAGIHDACAGLRRGAESVLGSVGIRYAVKANTEMAVLAYLARMGIEALCSHPAEVALALEAGFRPRDVWLQRPAFSETELTDALEAGIAGFLIASSDPVEAACTAAANGDRAARISFRLRCDGPGFRLSPIRQLARRIGLSAEEVVELARRGDGGRKRPVGLALYVGGGPGGRRRHRTGLRHATRVAAALSGRHGIPVDEIVVGGGLPCPGAREHGLAGLPRRLLDDWPGAAAGVEDLVAVSRALAEEFRDACRRNRLDPRPRLVMEPGRSLVGGAAVLVTRVLARRGRWLFLDASRNHLPESPLLLRRRVLPATLLGTGGPSRQHLCGGTLNTMDVIDMWRRLPQVAVGDALALCGAGAYSISRASRYASLSPAVLWLGRDGILRTVRRSEHVGDLLGPTVAPREEIRG